MQRTNLRQGAILIGSILICLLPFAVAGAYIYHKHQWAQARLDELEPRYARLAGLEAQAVLVPEADQTALGRLPSARLRGSVGYQADFGVWRFGGALGGDVVVSAYDNGRYLAPYSEATLTLPLGDRVSLSVNGAMSVDLIDAIDGLASFDRRAGIDAAVDLGRDVRFTAGAGMLWRRGVRDASFRFDEASLSAGLSGALAGAWRWRLALDRLRHREAGNDYDADGFGFGISGRI